MDHAAVIEILGRNGEVRAVHKVHAWPLTVGRSPRCDLVLDDAHLAPEHARLDWLDGQARLVLLPSLNGGRLGERRLQTGDALTLPPAEPFQLGATSLRLRSSLDPLPAELPLEQVGSAGRWLAPALALLWLGLLWFDQWANLNPGSRWTDYSAALLAPFGVLLCWVALCSLVTQLFRHRFPFGQHLRRALGGVTALHLSSMLLPTLAYAYSLPRLLALDAALFGIGVTALLWWHAVLIWPRAGRSLAWTFGGLLLLGTGLTVAKRQDQQYWLGPAYLSQLPPPVLRQVAPKPVDALIDALRPLEAQLATQAHRDDEALPEAAPD